MEEIKILEAITADLEKALTASTTSNLMSREQKAANSDFYVPSDITEVQLVGSNGRYNSAFEPVVFPRNRVNTPEVFEKSETFDSCEACGVVKKSLSPCKSCQYASSITEAKPFNLR